MAKNIPAQIVLALTNAELAQSIDWNAPHWDDRQIKELDRRSKPAPTKGKGQPPKRSNVAALKACRTMVTQKLAGATKAVRKQLLAKIADYDRRIAEAA